ncbi:MAG: shikimate kinase [Bacteroidota bacterium]
MKIFLIGMMGTGKSHWCKKLSKKLKTGGYDLDFLIESHEEKTIAEIFAEDGEDYFRRSEAKVLRWFKEKKEFVLATGGGSPCYLENMDWMNSQGITVWIDESIETLVERLKPEKAHRPLIQQLSDDELHHFLTKKLVERYPFYNRATYHLQGDAISDAGFAKIIKENA